MTLCTAPLTLITGLLVQDGMRSRMLHEPLIAPDRVSVVVSPTGYVVDWVTVIPRWVQVSADGTYRFTVRVVPL
ncbi:hypothetical protein Adu01nite_91350 [Paractinoplanes durhamensis]|uniref:Uncharacterized protein n=1 Tax=Paractinoplanes durhamensis TaxID=113563 RepID=A0ABQ3ZDC2_9ACTN|nr:hypothetical protein Adu01nite_91350 [Actinoplanes durhamensis]